MGSTIPAKPPSHAITESVDVEAESDEEVEVAEAINEIEADEDEAAPILNIFQILTNAPFH